MKYFWLAYFRKVALGVNCKHLVKAVHIVLQLLLLISALSDLQNVYRLMAHCSMIQQLFNCVGELLDYHLNVIGINTLFPIVKELVNHSGI